MNIGILALQGDFARHAARVAELGATPILVRRAETLPQLEGLIIPGGESTTLLRLLDPTLRDALVSFVRSEKPVLATCAGAILLAAQVEQPAQDSLALVDVDVARNAYGRQVDSFVDGSLSWTEEGKKFLLALQNGRKWDSETLEGIFIRAPRILRVGPEVSVLVLRGSEPVLIRQKNVLLATFHPELSANASAVHGAFLALSH